MTYRKSLLICALYLSITGTVHAATTLDPLYGLSSYGNFEYYGVTPQSYVYHTVNAISGDGSVILGHSYEGDGADQSMIFVGNTYTPEGLRIPNGYFTNNAYGVNYDGSVIVGAISTNIGGFSKALRWNGSNTPVLLADVPGFQNSYAIDLSDDASIIVGSANQNGGFSSAVRWVNDVPEILAPLAGNIHASANAISADGSVIIGESFSNADPRNAVRWVGNGAAEELGKLAGDISIVRASAINSDGSVIVGYNDFKALRWVNGTTAEELVSLPGANDSEAYAVSGDGSVIVGMVNDGVDNAVRWVGNNAAEKLSDILTAASVDLTGWQLEQARGVSSNGQIIIGNGDLNGQDTAFIMHVPGSGGGGGGGGGGITTPTNLAQSLGSVAQATQSVGQTAVAQLGQSIFLARNLMNFTTLSNPSQPAPYTGSDPARLSDILPSAGGCDEDSVRQNRNRSVACSQMATNYTWQVYTMGNVGIGSNNNYDNNSFSGTIGVKTLVTKDLGIGVGLLGMTGRNELAFNGQSDMSGRGASMIAAYEPQDSNLRIFSSLFAMDIDLDITRGYLNGGSLDSSRGKTGGFAYGGAVQTGWAMKTSEINTIMPYVEGRWTRTKIDSYTETGGGFAASFTDQKQDNSSIRFGVSNNYDIQPNLQLMGRVAWGHRLNGNGSGATANISGLTQTLGGQQGDRDWVEGAIGASYRATSATTISGELSARSGNTAEPQVGLLLAASVSF